MKIQHIFQDDINRSINGVIQVDQSNAEVIEQEVREYVITKDIKKHLCQFFDVYSQSFDTPTNNVNVWISGFFGSGKSHFLKMLSYLLENKQISDTSTVELFRRKFEEDPAAFMPIDRSTQGPTETILFNIGAAADKNQAKDPVLSVFAKKFYTHLGFCGEIPEVVHLEKYLAEVGKTEQFTQAFEQSCGRSWRDSRRNYGFMRAHVRTALVQALGMSDEDAKLYTQTKQSVDLSIDTLVQDIKKYVDSKPANYRLLFMIDEVAQFVGSEVPLLLSLQSIAEKLGSICRGKVWMVCTGQEAIDEIINKVQNDGFARISARFATRLSLSSSSVDEVIQKRLLKKKAEYTQELENVYEAKASTLRNLFTFKNALSDVRGYASASDFVTNFPFVPYQFTILQKVFAEIRRHGIHDQQHLAAGERSLLSGFQEAAQKVQEGNEHTLVPFYRFYDAVHSFLLAAIRQVIERADRAAHDGAGLQEYDVDVLKLLYLIRYIDKDIPANINNIAILMADDICVDKINLRQKVTESLERLLSQNYIRRSGEVYIFLTNEEQDIQRAIQNEVPVDTSIIVSRIASTIFEDIYSTKKIRFSKDYDPIPFNRYVDTVAVGNQNADIALRFLTVAADASDKSHMKLMNDSVKQAIAVLPEADYFAALEQAEKIRAYVKMRNVPQLPASTQLIIRAQQEEAIRLEEAAKEQLTKAILEADFYVAGELRQYRETDISGKIEAALRYLVANVYSELDQVDSLAQSEADIAAILSGKATQLQGLEANNGALALVEEYLSMQQMLNMPTSMHDLISRFSGVPYGWRELDIAALVARLVVEQKATVKHQGNTILPSHPKLPDMLRKSSEIGRTLITKRELVSATRMDTARKALREYLEVMNVPDKEDNLVAFIIEQFTAVITQHKNMLEAYKLQPHYPDRDIITQAVELLQGILNQKADNIALIKALCDKQDDLLDNKESLRDVEQFFRNQRPIFDASVRLLLDLRVDGDYLNEIQESKQAFSAMQEICFIEPGQKFNYSRIPDLNELMASLKSIHGNLLSAKREELRDILQQCHAAVTEAAGADHRFRSVSEQADRFYQEKLGIIDSYPTITLLEGLTSQLTKKKDECLERIEEINAYVPAKQPNSGTTATPTPSAGTPATPPPHSGTTKQPTPQEQPKKQRTIYRTVVFPTGKLRSAADVDAYVKQLRTMLNKQLHGVDILSIQ